jgi:hypothetical protein
MVEDGGGAGRRAVLRTVERVAHRGGLVSTHGAFDLLQLGDEGVNKDRLYRGLDHLLAYKTELEAHLSQRCGELFAIQNEVLLYDVTSTYFEGQAATNPQVQRGYSRDHRPDCKQVCIALVVTFDGSARIACRLISSSAFSPSCCGRAWRCGRAAQVSAIRRAEITAHFANGRFQGSLSAEVALILSAAKVLKIRVWPAP